MRNELTINTTTGSLQLFSSLDAGENSLIINGNTIPAASWTGSGAYTTTIGGVTYTITKAAADTGNLQLIQTGAAAFAFRDINGLKDGTFKDLSCGIDTTAASGTTDGDLYRAINALGWASDVISSALLNVKKLFTNILTAINGIGTVVGGTNLSATVSVPNNTGTKISSITLTAGTWLVLANADWAPSATGYRQIMFNANTTNPARDRANTTAALGTGKDSYQQLSIIVMPTATTTYDIYGLQTSGGALNCWPYTSAVRLK